MSSKKHDTRKHASSADTGDRTADGGLDELRAKYLRALADYQNLEKRTQEAFAERERRAGETIIRKLLPVADTLEMAEKHVRDTGLSLAVKELRTVLKDSGLVRLETVGKAFDPTEMECVEVVTGKANHVVEEVLPGYLLSGVLVRPAKVKVGSGEQPK